MSKLDEARELLARANRMIANEGVLDAFGHVTMRHPTDQGRYLMSRSRAPELVQPDDIHDFDLESQIIKPVSYTHLDDDEPKKTAIEIARNGFGCFTGWAHQHFKT